MKVKDETDDRKDRERERDRDRDRGDRNWQDKSGMSMDFSTKVASNKVPDEQWVERLDMRIAALISRDKVDPKEYGGKDPDE